MANEARPVTRREANEFSMAEGTSLDGAYTQEQLEAENKFALSGERQDLDQEHEAASEEKKWAVDRYSDDGTKETSLYTDQELDQEMDRIAEERATGDQVDLRLATPEDQDQDREQSQGDLADREAEQREADERESDQREQEQRDQDQQREADQREQQQRAAEQEQHEMDDHLRQVAELQQREQAEEQARQQQQDRPAEGIQQKDPLLEQVIRDAHEGRTDPEAMQRLDRYEERTEREAHDRQDQDREYLRQEMLQGKEHYYGFEQSIEPENGDSSEHWRYNPELQAAAEQHFSQGQERAGGQADGREERREQSAPSPAVEMEMER